MPPISKINPYTGQPDLVGSSGGSAVAGTVVFIGNINLPGDFPTSALVKKGYTYYIGTDVTDSDGTKTATGLSFKVGDIIMRNGATWIKYGYFDIASHQFITGLANPAHSEGLIFYDSTKKAVSYYNDEADVTINIGQETIIRVKNETGAIVPNGSVVYPTGSDGTDILIGLANASEKLKCRLIGVATHSIENMTTGYVTKFGEVGGLDTSMYTSGDILYLSNADGQITTTKPTGGSFITQVGVVKIIHATAGSIFVDISTTEFSVEASQVVGRSPTDKPTISFSDATRTLTVTPTATTFRFYQFGDKYTKLTDSIQIPDEEGTFVIYYNLGTITYVKNPTSAQIAVLIPNNPLVAYVYWNAVDNKAEYIGNELHEIGMSGDTHLYAHFAFGARYISGIQPTGYNVTGNGSSDAHAQVGFTAGGISDEDIYHPTPAIASTVGLPIAYIAGTDVAPTLRFTTNAGFAFLNTGTGRVAYNRVVAGNRVLSESTSDDFVLLHIIAINENNQNKRVIALVGQANYTTTTLARAGARLELKTLYTTGLFPQEKVNIATFIIQTNISYTNSVNARFVQISATEPYIDRTETSIGNPGSTSVTSTFDDAQFEVYDDGDISKKVGFEVSGVTTGTKRIITVPDANSTTVTTGAQTFGGVKTFTVSPIVPIPTTPTQSANKEYVDEVDDNAFFYALAFG